MTLYWGEFHIYVKDDKETSLFLNNTVAVTINRILKKRESISQKKGRHPVVNINNNVLMIEVWLGTFYVFVFINAQHDPINITLGCIEFLTLKTA